MWPRSIVGDAARGLYIGGRPVTPERPCSYGLNSHGLFRPVALEWLESEVGVVAVAVLHGRRALEDDVVDEPRV